MHLLYQVLHVEFLKLAGMPSAMPSAIPVPVPSAVPTTNEDNDDGSGEAMAPGLSYGVLAGGAAVVIVAGAVVEYRRVKHKREKGHADKREMELSSTSDHRSRSIDLESDAAIEVEIPAKAASARPELPERVLSIRYAGSACSTI